MKYTYRSGERPLDGYTIKRGVGHGGFGEVYFALSDGGKEVALKLLRGHSDVELRGVANCLNMKHPNLVHVYDLREDDRGDKWLVMEFVLGESLSTVLHRHPHGVPISLVKEWFAALARAVGHLHDRGVVHRDLKPGNIFIEAGTLKVGDYGLCKSISTSQKQTRTVGTVHYMAPEVSTGNYSQRIDVYACGVILFELLTGKVPFDGESDGEILMKHLTASVDLSPAPEAFRPILAKALDKNPLKRYASVGEMARAVDDAIDALALPKAVPVHPHEAVPTAIRVAAAVPPPLPVSPPSPAAQPAAAPVAVLSPPVPAAKLKDQTALPMARSLTWRDRAAGLTGGLLLGPLVAGIGLIPYALVFRTLDWGVLGELFLVTAACTWAVLLGSGFAESATTDSWRQRLRLGGLGMLVGVLAFWLSGWHLAKPTGEADSSLMGVVNLNADSFSVAARYLLYFGGVMTAGRWWRAVARDRKERFSLFPALTAGFWSCVLLFLWPAWEPTRAAFGGIVPVVLAVVAAQAVSPWSPRPVGTPLRKLKL